MLSGSAASGVRTAADDIRKSFQVGLDPGPFPLHDRGDPAEVEMQGHNHRQAVGRSCRRTFLARADVRTRYTTKHFLVANSQALTPRGITTPLPRTSTPAPITAVAFFQSDRVFI